MSSGVLQTPKRVPAPNDDTASSNNSSQNMDPLFELKQKLLHYARVHEHAPPQEYIEVCSSIYIGDASVAYNLELLKQLNVGRVLSATDINQCTDHPSTMKEYYIAHNILFMSIFNASPCRMFVSEKHFEAASEFIHLALTSRAKVLVVCSHGDNLSAGLLAAYFMLYSGYTLMRALDLIAGCRAILLDVTIQKQLFNLNAKLQRQPGFCLSSAQVSCTCIPRCVVGDLLEIMNIQHDRMIISERWDEVYPGIIISDSVVGQDLGFLLNMGVRWVLNANHEPSVISQDTYRLHGMNSFIGFSPQNMNRLQYEFRLAAFYIDGCVRSNSRILVYCRYGIGRSVCLVAAYFMIKKKFTAKSAFELIGTRRNIMPNRYYLRQLLKLDNRLRTQR